MRAQACACLKLVLRMLLLMVQDCHKDVNQDGVRRNCGMQCVEAMDCVIPCSMLSDACCSNLFSISTKISTKISIKIVTKSLPNLY